MQDRDNEPLFFAFGRSPSITFLTQEESKEASFDDRVKSIWPFIVGRVKAFCASLYPREAANYDGEDILLEVWIALKERDHRYDPVRGSYLSFAGSIIRNCLYRIREESRTVQSPQNSTCRLKDYDRSESLSPAKQGTRDAIVRTISGTIRLGDGECSRDATLSDKDSSSCVEEDECREKTKDALLDAILEKLSPYEAVVLGAANGLWGDRASIRQISRATESSTDAVRKAKASAYAKIREFIESTSPSIA